MQRQTILAVSILTRMANEIYKLRTWATILQDIIKEYPGRTIENVLGNIEARIKEKSNEK